jgi:hypothetical protein
MSLPIFVLSRFLALASATAARRNLDAPRGVRSPAALEFPFSKGDLGGIFQVACLRAQEPLPPSLKSRLALKTYS